MPHFTHNWKSVPYPLTTFTHFPLFLHLSPGNHQSSVSLSFLHSTCKEFTQYHFLFSDIVQVKPCTRVSFALWNSRSVPRRSQPVAGPAIRRAVGCPGTGMRAAPTPPVRPPQAFPLRPNPEAAAALGLSLGLQNAPQQPRSGNLEIKTTNKLYSSHACRIRSTGPLGEVTGRRRPSRRAWGAVPVRGEREGPVWGSGVPPYWWISNLKAGNNAQAAENKLQSGQLATFATA